MRATARNATRGILTALVAITAVIATSSVTQAATPSPTAGAAIAAPVPAVRTVLNAGNGAAQTFTNAQLDALYPHGVGDCPVGRCAVGDMRFEVGERGDD